MAARAAVRDADGELVAGLAGWTWGGCGYVDSCRSEPTVADEARARGCTQMVLSTHSFQAPEIYLRGGYIESGRI